MAPHTAWEWLEQYGPIQLSGTITEKSHEERERTLTGILTAAKSDEQLERKLKETSTMAKKKAKLVLNGSGYGALTKRGKWSEHLEFVASSDSLKKWQSFFETGALHKPSVKEVPDEFLIDGENLNFILNTLDSSNKENWYAFYQAGIGCVAEEDFLKAKELLRKSWNLEANPWACHGLACIGLFTEKNEEAAEWMLKGLEMENENISYLKEGFRILFLCRAYQELIAFYESQNSKIQEIGKLKFYYISALHKIGKNEEAYEMLEENGGLVIDDIREGEDSLAKLWSELYESLYSKKAPVPYRYDFKAF